MTVNPDIRWKQRFQNFERAFTQEALESGPSKLSLLEKEGVIQRFEYWVVACDISHEDLIALVNMGLRATHGSYKKVAKLFHVGEEDYRRLMDFLRRSNCILDPRPFRKRSPSDLNVTRVTTERRKNT